VFASGEETSFMLLLVNLSSSWFVISRCSDICNIESGRRFPYSNVLSMNYSYGCLNYVTYYIHVDYMDNLILIYLFC
jgi:hypothetical protein